MSPLAATAVGPELGAASIPPAVQLAQRCQPELDGAFRELDERLKKEGKQQCLAAFLGELRAGGISINLSVSLCADFLKKGRYLNIYEYHAKRTRKKGAALLKVVKKASPKWYSQRIEFERFLQFEADAHYASLNLGGAGLTRYGECCVLLDPVTCCPFRTCFAGDPLRAAFSKRRRRVIPSKDVLARFAVHQAIAELAAVNRPDAITADAPFVTPAAVRQVFEASDSPIEIHIHGAVLVSHIKAIALAEADYRHLWDVTCRYERAGRSERAAMEFDVVPHFKRLVSRTKELGVPLLRR